MTATITKNTEKNGIEIKFAAVPAREVLEALKVAGFRWHNVKKVWYAKDTEETAAFAEKVAKCGNVPESEMQKPDVLDAIPEGWEILKGATTAPNGFVWIWNKKSRFGGEYKAALVPKDAAKTTIKKSPAKMSALPSLFDRCDVSTIPEHNRRMMTKEICAEVRAHLKARFPECKFSIRTPSRSSIDADIVASPYSCEKVYTDKFGEPLIYGRFVNSPELDAVLAYCDAYLQSYNYDNSDPMTDYFDVNFYGRFGIASEYEQTEPTEEQKASASDFIERKTARDQAIREREERERAESLRRMEEAQKAAQIEAEKQRIEMEEIESHVTVKDLPEEKHIAVIGLLNGIGKECSLDELRETIEERRPTRSDAIITRQVLFESYSLFKKFTKMFLHDFSFLSNMGGTGTEDVRIESVETFEKLTSEQWETVKTYSANCVGVYLNGEFQFVVDPQGYGYARYVMLPDDSTDSYLAAEKLPEWREKSESLPAFYFPEDVRAQLSTSELEQGDTFTMIKLDEWILTATTTNGTLQAITPSDSYQHKDAVIMEYTPIGGRKQNRIQIHGGQALAIFKGILPDVPESIRYRDVSERAYGEYTATMREALFAGSGAKDYIINAIEYYKTIGYYPVVDTIQR